MKKYRSAILAIVIIAMGVLVFGLLAKNREPVNTAPIEVKALKVKTQKVQVSAIPYNIEVTGVLTSKNKIEVFSETQGVLKKLSKEFKIGTRFQKGEILVAVNSKEFEAQINSNRSNLMNQIAGMLADMQIDYPKAYKKWEVYLENFNVEKTTPKLPAFESNGEKLFVSGKNIYQTYFTIKNLEERLAKYKITAPFNGIVTESNINSGTLVRSGQKLGEFIDDSVFEIHLSVPAAENAFLKMGSKVTLSSVDGSAQYTGKVLRINGAVDQTTQTVLVVVELRSKALKEGQYLKALIDGKEVENALNIDNSLIVENNKVFIVENNQLRLKDIQIINYKEGKALVQGLENGMQLVNETLAGAYPGMKVEMQ